MQPSIAPQLLPETALVMDKTSRDFLKEGLTTDSWIDRKVVIAKCHERVPLPQDVQGKVIFVRRFPEELRISKCAAEGLDWLVSNTQYWGDISTLPITRCNLMVEAIRPLISSPHLDGIRSLDLSYNDLGDAGAEATARSEALRELRSPDLRWNDIEPAGVAAIRESPHLKNLKDFKH